MRILSLDGMSAASLQIRLIRHYEERCPGFLSSVDVFCGASDGGFMALYLARHLTDDHATNLRVVDDAVRFNDELVPLFRVSLMKAARFASGLYPLLYGNELRDLFAKHLGEGSLGDLPRKVIIGSYGSQSWQPRLFTNVEEIARPPYTAHSDTSLSLVDVASATSALPLALPLATVGKQRLVDGGWVANNPTLLGVGMMVQAQVDGGLSRAEAFDRLRVLSLGCTTSKDEHEKVVRRQLFGIRKRLYERSEWGWLQWVALRPLLLLEMTLQGAMDVADFQCRALLSDERYRRIRPPLDELGVGFQLMLRRPEVFIGAMETTRATLTSTPEWSDRNTTWIRDRFMA